MFSNRFNTKNDPLLEAVSAAMKDGDVRRQAEALVNEEFGVYSRNAVVRENLNAYDAALEEAYAALKEGKDESSRWHQAMEKKKKHGKGPEAHKANAVDAKSDYSKMREKMVGKGKDYETTKKIVGEAKADKDYDGDGKIESSKDEVWGSRLKAAKAAGKDLGKPGKNFSKIAGKAGKKYGSVEAGKKVAGAILKRIRAKHMKEENLEELSAFGSAFAAARKSGQTNFSFGGKSYNTKLASSPKPAPTVAPKPASGSSLNPVSSAQAATPADVKGNVAAMKAGQSLAANDAKNMRAGNSGQTNATVTNTDSKGNTTSAAKPEGGMWNSIKQAVYDKTGLGSDNRGAAEKGIGSTSAAADGNGGKSVGTGTATPVIKNAMKPSLNESVQVGENKYRIV